MLKVGDTVAHTVSRCMNGSCIFGVADIQVDAHSKTAVLALVMWEPAQMSCPSSTHSN